MRRMVIKGAVIAATLKGVVIASVLYALGITWWQQLIVAAVSALITGLFVLLAAAVTAREVARNREALHDVKRGLGLDKREADHNDNTPI